MTGILIKDCRLYLGDRLRTRDILIRGRRIVRIAKKLKPQTEEIIEARGRLLAPGFIDAHSHWREPGFSHKETIITASRSAAKGGFTTALLMPNLNPVPDNLKDLKREIDLIKRDSIIRAIPYGAITLDQAGREVSRMEEMSKFVVGYSDDGRAIQDAKIMLEAMQTVKSLNKIIASHCEDYSFPNGHITECDMAKNLNIKTITPLAESVQLARDIELVRESESRYHLCHISNGVSLKLIELAKKEGLKISCEVTPHHLISSVEDIDGDNGNWKMKPPLAKETDRRLLIKALRDGIIDIVATDHAPHTKEEKSGGFNNSEFGIIGLESAFSLLYTNLVLKKQLSLKRLVDSLTKDVARIFKLRTGRIEEGAKADLVLIDLKLKRRIEEGDILSKGKNSPYIGREIYGIPVLTISEGKIVYVAEGGR